MSEHLQQVRFAGAEEPGDPHPVAGGVVGVRLQKQLKTFGCLIGENVLVYLRLEMRRVVGLDDALNRALYVLGEDLIELHQISRFLFQDVLGPVVLVVLESPEKDE